MARHTLRINRPRLQAVGEDEARRKVNRVVRRAFNRSQVLCPVDDGPLRASGAPDYARARGALVIGSITYGAKYAAAVHNGRRALTIKARRPGGYLKFTVDGRTVFARQVHQPARAARPFLATALREVAAAEGFTVSIP